MNSMAEKVVIVTGGSTGIGRATALAFAKEGANVVVAARNLAAGLGTVGFPEAGIYSASKHAVIGLTKTAALEYAKSGIRINAVSPGGVQTPMVDRFAGEGQEVKTNFAQMHPLGRLANPEEIANAAIWLCSNQASFVTGHALAVDGGWTAQ